MDWFQYDNGPRHESGTKIKIDLNFYASLWCLKGFYESF